MLKTICWSFRIRCDGRETWKASHNEQSRQSGILRGRQSWRENIEYKPIARFASIGQPFGAPYVTS